MSSHALALLPPLEQPADLLDKAASIIEIAACATVHGKPVLELLNSNSEIQKIAKSRATDPEKEIAKNLAKIILALQELKAVVPLPATVPPTAASSGQPTQQTRRRQTVPVVTLAASQPIVVNQFSQQLTQIWTPFLQITGLWRPLNTLGQIFTYVPLAFGGFLTISVIVVCCVIVARPEILIRGLFAIVNAVPMYFSYVIDRAAAQFYAETISLFASTATPLATPAATEPPFTMSNTVSACLGAVILAVAQRMRAPGAV